MGEHRIPRDVKLGDKPQVPTIQEQQKAKWGSEFKCRDCIHAYRVLVGDTEVLQCYEGPPGSQLVQMRTPLGQVAEAQKQLWTTVHPDQFCDKFQRDLNAPKSPLLGAN